MLKNFGRGGASQADVAAILAAVDEEVAAILEDTGTTLDALIKAIPTTAMRGTDGAALASAWTAILATKLATLEHCIVAMGGIEDAITCASDADPTAPDAVTKVTPDIPEGANITKAYIVMICRAIEDTSAAGNYVGTAGVVQVQKVAGGSWVTGIALPAGALDVGASEKGAGFAIVGEADIKAQIADATQVQFQIVTLRAFGSSIVLHDVQFGLKIYYKL